MLINQTQLRFDRSISGTAYRCCMDRNGDDTWSVSCFRYQCGTYQHMPAYDRPLCLSEHDARNQVSVVFGMLAVTDAMQHELQRKKA